MEVLPHHSLNFDALGDIHVLSPLHLKLVTHCAQVDSRELQVLYPLLEFLHHHRLNAADTHALADAFAPLLMRLECDSAPRDQDYLAQAYGLLTDTLIQRYRTLFSGTAALFLYLCTSSCQGAGRKSAASDPMSHHGRPFLSAHHAAGWQRGC